MTYPSSATLDTPPMTRSCATQRARPQARAESCKAAILEENRRHAQSSPPAGTWVGRAHEQAKRR